MVSLPLELESYLRRCDKNKAKVAMTSVCKILRGSPITPGHQPKNTMNLHLPRLQRKY